MPQLALQQTWPTLQVFIPHVTLNGMVGPSHVVEAQVSPGTTQVPQLALQQTWPTLQVFIPHATLNGISGRLQTLFVQELPGTTQMPQLALQHSWSAEHMIGPQAEGAGRSGAVVGTGAGLSGGEGRSVALGFVGVGSVAGTATASSPCAGGVSWFAADVFAIVARTGGNTPPDGASMSARGVTSTPGDGHARSTGNACHWLVRIP
jgi:hypothetical protein